MARKRAKKTFSAVKAVKANARERVGQPKAERVIEEKPRTGGRGGKHKPTLGKMLEDWTGRPAPDKLSGE